MHGCTQAEHDDNLPQVFERLKANHFTINRENYVFNQEKSVLWAYLDATRNMKTPENAEVKSLLEMAGYVSRMIPNFATITEPLRRLTTSNVPWEFGKEQETSLEKLQGFLQSDRVMAYCDPKKHTELVVDASPVGLGAILAQRESGEEEEGKSSHGSGTKI